MSSSRKNLLGSGDARLSSSSKGASLNPNAAEFIPSGLRYLPTKSKNVDVPKTDSSGISANNILYQSNSDDESHQHWHFQLPDDITPDFNSIGKDDFSLSGLSINDGISTHHILGNHLEMSPRGTEKKSINHELDYASTSLLHSRSNHSENLLVNNSWNLNNLKDKGQYSADPGTGFPDDPINEHIASERMMLEHFELLSSQFPDLALENLAEAYYTNGCDLNMTIEMLNPELKVEGGLNLSRSSKAFSSPTLNELDFHLLPENGNGVFPNKSDGFSLFKSPSFSDNPLGSRDFIPSSHKIRSQDPQPWKYDDGLVDAAKIGQIRNSQVLVGPYNVHGKAHPGHGKIPVDYTMGQVYSDMREEAQDLARLRSAFYEQREKEVYSLGRKALGKESGAKGQLYNMQIKEAQEKSRELMHHQRGQNPLIDLHGLHVNEAIHVLKHELSILKRTAKSAGRRLQVMVCVGVEGPTRSLRPPARLPAIVQQYLLHENLHFSEDQPGLLRVVIC